MRTKLGRGIALLLAMAFVLALCASTAFAAVTGTTTAKLNKRSAPSTSASKKGTIAKGATVTVSDTIGDGETYSGTKVKGDWYKLSTGEFISADYVTLDEEELPPDDEGEEELPLDDEELPPDDEELPLDDVYDNGVVIDDDNGGVEIVGDDDGVVLDDGSDVELEEEEIPLDEEDIPPDEEDEMPIEDEDEELSGTVNASSLKIRSAPSTSASTIGSLTRNTSIIITGQYNEGDKFDSSTVKGNWYEFDHDGRSGYVSADYIRIASTVAGEAYTLKIKTTKTVYKTTAKVTVYKLPTKLAATDGTLASGTTVTVKKTYKDGSTYTGLSAKVSGTWYQIGTNRFVQTGSIKASTSTVTADVEVSIGDTLTATTTVNQRAKPSTSATKLGKIEKGKAFTVVGVVIDGSVYNGTTVKGNWVQVKGGGFVSADYVQK